jgi:hypothetical protein
MKITVLHDQVHLDQIKTTPAAMLTHDPGPQDQTSTIPTSPHTPQSHIALDGSYCVPWSDSTMDPRRIIISQSNPHIPLQSLANINSSQVRHLRELLRQA